MITIMQQGAQTLIVTPTMFPDGTSQVWKLPLENYDKNRGLKIVWQFEQEAELIWLAQLIQLLGYEHYYITEIYIPYLPYGRQDKNISNEQTFALRIFSNILNSILCGMSKVTTLDPHPTEKIISGSSYSPRRYIQQAIKNFQADIVVFPDAGAYNRYKDIIDGWIPYMVFDKVRDQSSGNITGLEINKNLTSVEFWTMLSCHKILIVDDICDGGATFIKTAQEIFDNFVDTPIDIGLYVTHGIFSKGFEALQKAGITSFYTTQSLPRNTNAFPLEEL